MSDFYNDLRISRRCVTSPGFCSHPRQAPGIISTSTKSIRLSAYLELLCEQGWEAALTDLHLTPTLRHRQRGDQFVKSACRRLVLCPADTLRLGKRATVLLGTVRSTTPCPPFSFTAHPLFPIRACLRVSYSNSSHRHWRMHHRHASHPHDL